MNTTSDQLPVQKAPTTSPFTEYAGKGITQLPPKRWLVDQIVGKHDFVMIFGESGSGKTFLAVELAMCCITGREFAKNFAVREPIRVAYMTNEGVSGLGQRFRSAARKHKPTQDEWSRLHVFIDLLQFVNEGNSFHFSRFVEQWRSSYPDADLDLLILDHLSGTLPGKGDSDSGAATLLHSGVATLRRELGTSVVMIHHTGYNRSHSRGMTTYKDISDVQIQIKSVRNPRTMVCAKNKDGERWPAAEFKLANAEESSYIVWTGQAGSGPSTSADDDYIGVLNEAGTPLTAAQVASKLGVVRKTAYNKLKRLYDNGRVIRERRQPDKPNSRTNPYVYSPPQD